MSSGIIQGLQNYTTSSDTDDDQPPVSSRDAQYKNTKRQNMRELIVEKRKLKLVSQKMLPLKKAD